MFTFITIHEGQLLVDHHQKTDFAAPADYTQSFPLSDEGKTDLAKFMRKHGIQEVSCSSDVDFAYEFGIEIDVWHFVEQALELAWQQGLRKALVEMWEKRNSHSDDYGVIYDNADREDAYYYGSLAERTSDSVVICTYRDDWGQTPLDEYESGEEFADMAMSVFEDDLLVSRRTP